jgi:hypothetical protein
MKRNNSKWFWQVLLAAALLAVGGVFVISAHAQGNLAATLSANSGDVTVGDVIPLTLQVTHPAGWRVIFPKLEKQWGDFEVRGQSTPQIAGNADGTQTSTQEIQVARMRPGQAQTPELSLQVADDQGSLSSVEVAPLAIEVSSVLVQGDTNLREIKAQADLVTERRPIWPLLAAGLLSTAMLSLYGVQRWRQRKQVDRRTPRQRAVDALAALSAQNPHAYAEIKTQCAGLADSLRDYLAAVTRLPARDLTTRELTRRLMEQEIPAQWSTQMISILKICDGVKFANDELEAATLQALIALGRKLVEQYPAQPQPAPRRTGRKTQAEVRA